MANLYTSSTGNLAGTAGAAGLVQKAYDRLLEFALRSEPLIRSVADKKPAKLANPGSTVVLQLYADLAESTTALTESTEKDSVALSAPTSVTITLAEYGNSVLVTRALELFSLADVDPAIANIIAFNLAGSIDTVAQTTLRAGTNIIYGGTRTNTVTIAATDTITLPTSVRLLLSCVQVCQYLVKVQCTGAVFTQKSHTIYVLRLVLVDGVCHTNTTQMKTFGLEKLVHMKEPTS